MSESYICGSIHETLHLTAAHGAVYHAPYNAIFFCWRKDKALAHRVYPGLAVAVSFINSCVLFADTFQFVQSSPGRGCAQVATNAVQLDDVTPSRIYDSHLDLDHYGIKHSSRVVRAGAW